MPVRKVSRSDISLCSSKASTLTGPEPLERGAELGDLGLERRQRLRATRRPGASRVSGSTPNSSRAWPTRCSRSEPDPRGRDLGLEAGLAGGVEARRGPPGSAASAVSTRIAGGTRRFGRRGMARGPLVPRAARFAF